MGLTEPSFSTATSLPPRSSTTAPASAAKAPARRFAPAAETISFASASLVWGASFSFARTERTMSISFSHHCARSPANRCSAPIATDSCSISREDMESGS